MILSIDNIRNQAIVDAWAEKIWPSKSCASKSRECSMVLKMMDSELYGSGILSYENIVDTVSLAMGANKKKLNEELNKYI